jgi:hypothetical protein
MSRLRRGILRKRRELLLSQSTWRHPGFYAHIGEPIPPEDNKAIEDVASHLVKAPLSLKKLIYLDGQKAVVYRSKMNPTLGRNVEAMDPLEWLAHLADHILDPLTATTRIGLEAPEPRRRTNSSPRGATRRVEEGRKAASGLPRPKSCPSQGSTAGLGGPPRPRSPATARAPGRSEGAASLRTDGPVVIAVAAAGAMVPVAGFGGRRREKRGSETQGSHETDDAQLHVCLPEAFTSKPRTRDMGR